MWLGLFQNKLLLSYVACKELIANVDLNHFASEFISVNNTLKLLGLFLFALSNQPTQY